MTKAENKFDMHLEDVILVVTGKEDLLQSYLKTQANSMSVNHFIPLGQLIYRMDHKTYRFKGHSILVNNYLHKNIVQCKGSLL